MRKQFVRSGVNCENELGFDGPANFGKFIDCDGDEFDGLPALVVHDAPWAAIAVEVDGGYLAFESVIDYQTWFSQK